MKITIIKEKLAEAVQAITGLVAKDALSPFSKMRLDASGRVSITGSNGHVQIECQTDGKIERLGSVTVPGASFAAFVNSMPKGDISVILDGGKLSVKSGDVHFRLAANAGNEFAAIGALETESEGRLEIPAALFREMMRKVRYAASSEEARPILCGVNIALESGTLGMTATDGKRLAHVEMTRDDFNGSPDFNIVLPSKTVETIYRLLQKSDCGILDIVTDGKKVRIVSDDWCVTAKVLEDRYPNWRRVLPGDMQHAIEFDRKLFLDALTRASLACGEDNAVEIAIGDGMATFEAKNDLTDARTRIYCKTGNAGKCVFWANPRLLKDALEAIDEDIFTFSFDKGGANPIKITCSTIPWVYVMMPYRT